ncbi:MAG: ferrichrome ABC transporter permease [Chloroflexi bacterium]|nr:ferrichrome ABC transporter permease [Chloroflexota bacterium]
MIYYAISIFLSAFLLFQVQPMLGKYILPWFGGTPAVWSTTMLFFQAALTGGYAYADWLIGRLGEKRQGAIHWVVVSASLILLAFTALIWRAPVLPDASWQPRGVDTPIGDILKILTVAIGLPYFLLATNGPLMQAWFNRKYPGRSPYRLYALSNVASLLALLTYPLLIEPLFTVQQQAQLWSLAWVAFALLALYGAFQTMRHAAPPTTKTEEARARPAAKRFALWLALSACASVLLLAITSEISQELAVIPFLWILPLTIYLLTFILCFESERGYSRLIFTPALFVFSALFALIFGRVISVSLYLAMGAYAALLFVACMICHGELARLKPHPRHLTAFYLTISIGGALGGSATSLLAPNVFKSYWELPLGLLACAILLFIVTLRYRVPGQTARATRNLATLMGGTIVLLGGLCILYVKTTSFDPLFVARNFFGVVRVVEINGDDPARRAYMLGHGATSHGYQFIAPERRQLTTTYYTENGGGGLALLGHPKRPGALRVGILGLGIGVLSAYGQPGDLFRYYEINPEVVRLAQGAGGYFDFVRASRAQTQIVLGDARIALEQELAAGQAQNFDLLILDVFNSDSIPVHLVTREAFAVYLQHLQPDGILALHISNNFLDLSPVVWKISDELNLGAALIKNPRGDDRASPSIWMIVTRDRAFLNQAAIARRTSPREVNLANFRVWTDDYSNLFQILK